MLSTCPPSPRPPTSPPTTSAWWPPGSASSSCGWPAGCASTRARASRRRNSRLVFTGQRVSRTCTWMQSAAQGWLVLKLTGSGVALGLTTALQFLPLLLFGVWGGVIADRFDKRRSLLWTQTAAGTLALVL